MKREELIKKLENVRLPDIELESHRNHLKMELLDSDCFKKEREVGFMEAIKVRTAGVIDAIMERFVRQQPAWRVALASVFAIALILTGIFAGPTLGPKLASLFPQGTIEVGGPQLTVEQKELAMEIMAADAGVQELVRQGAIIEPKLILPLEVTASGINSTTGEPEEITETWAQAWLNIGERQVGVQIDLVRGVVVAISD